MVQLLAENHKKNTLRKVVFKDNEIHSLRIVKHPYTPEYRTVRPPKQQSTSHIIAMYAFSIFGLNKETFINIASFPKHFICNHLMPEDQIKVNSAVKLFRFIEEKYGAAKYSKLRANKVSEYSCELNRSAKDEVIALSKTYKKEEIFFVYNTSPVEAKERFIKLDRITADVKQMMILYGYEQGGHINVTHATINGEKTAYVKLYLKPQHLVILKSL